MPNFLPRFDGDDGVPNNLEKPFTVKVCSGALVGGLPRYSWVQQAFDPGTASYLDMPSPRQGVENLKEINDINMLSGTPFYADARLLGIVSGNLFYQFEGASGAAGSTSSCMCCTSGTASGSFICISGYPESVPVAYSGSVYTSGLAPIGIVPPSWSGSSPVSGLPPIGMVPGYQSGSIAISGGYLLAGAVPSYLSGADAISGANAPYPPIVPPYQSGSVAISGAPAPPVPGVVPGYLSGSVPISGAPGIQPGIVPSYLSGSRVVSGTPGIWPGIVPPGWPFLTAISGIPPWPGLAGSDYIAISGYGIPLPSSLSGYQMISGWGSPVLSGSVLISGYSALLPGSASGYVMVSGSAVPVLSGKIAPGSRLDHFTGLTQGLSIPVTVLNNALGIHGTILVTNTSGSNSLALQFDCTDVAGGITSGFGVLVAPSNKKGFCFDTLTPGGTALPPFTKINVYVVDNVSGQHTGYNLYISTVA